MCTGEIYFDVGVPNNWKPPSRDDIVWSGPQDKKLKSFCEDHVKIKKSAFHENQVQVSHILKQLYKELKKLETSHKFLRFRPFLKQGGARERLKVCAADEFDALLPFTFMGVTTSTVESHGNTLPAGLGEIVVKNVNRHMTIQPKGLFVQRDGKTYVDSCVFHEKLIKGRIDAALQKLSQNPDFACYNIRRKASAPAIQLDVTINGKNVSIDVVPGFDIRNDNSTIRKFMVSRWVPDSQNKQRVNPIPHPTTAWRVSHSQFEMRILDRWISGNKTAQRLVRAARILKGVRVEDKERNSSSQLHHVLTSYHIKNILLHSILHLKKINDVELPSVTSALKHLVHMLDKSFEHKNLPQFFSNNPSLATYFPIYDFHTTHPNVNLFQERSDGEIQQMRTDLKKALDHCHLSPLLENTATQVHEDKLRPFLDMVRS